MYPVGLKPVSNKPYFSKFPGGCCWDTFCSHNKNHRVDPATAQVGEMSGEAARVVPLHSNARCHPCLTAWLVLGWDQMKKLVILNSSHHYCVTFYSLWHTWKIFIYFFKLFLNYLPGANTCLHQADNYFLLRSSLLSICPHCIFYKHTNQYDKNVPEKAANLQRS